MPLGLSCNHIYPGFIIIALGEEQEEMNLVLLSRPELKIYCILNSGV
jgi:hypothetical protein